MKITTELLEKYGADKSIIDYLVDNGLHGGDLIEIMNSEEVPLKLLHFLRKYVSFSREEEEKYRQICRIDMNSRNIWESEDVINSMNVMRSSHINNVNLVRDSKDTRDSSEVYYSNEIHGSQEVAWCQNIVSSDYIYKSSNVRMSEMVARSSNIDWCENILSSKNLFECGYVYQSEDLNNCYFCGFMKNSNHCLFCTGLEDKEYYIFNQKVEPQDFERIMEELRERLQVEDSEMFKINMNTYSAEDRYNVSRRLDVVFNGLSSDFYGWIGTTLNYSDDAFVELFFMDREENLKNKEK